MNRQPDLVCFSHLRWGFVHQRPNHVMSRFAEDRRVFFIEEPIHGAEAGVLRSTPAPNLTVVTPVVPRGASAHESESLQRTLIAVALSEHAIQRPALWFYTPMAMPLARGIDAAVVVYDCMDELSAFKGAPPQLPQRERELLAVADVVFTGGRSLYEAKRAHHRNIHALPSSVDFAHFAVARCALPEPVDQARIPPPRVGYFGVLDERLDLEILRSVARARPRWQLVLVGPVAKIDPRTLPRAENIHYLGPKRYQDLPAYLAGWDVAMMPFALNEATRFISPTKTLEYLAAGKPVVSTAIRDVVDPYAEHGVVRIADERTFVRAIESALDGEDDAARAAADALLRETSWDSTFRRMNALVELARAHRGATETTCSIG